MNKHVHIQSNEERERKSRKKNKMWKEQIKPAHTKHIASETERRTRLFEQYLCYGCFACCSQLTAISTLFFILFFISMRFVIFGSSWEVYPWCVATGKYDDDYDGKCVSSFIRKEIENWLKCLMLNAQCFLHTTNIGNIPSSY